MTADERIEQAIVVLLAGGPRTAADVKATVAAFLDRSTWVVEKAARRLRGRGELSVTRYGQAPWSVWSLPGQEPRGSCPHGHPPEQQRRRRRRSGWRCTECERIHARANRERQKDAATLAKLERALEARKAFRGHFDEGKPIHVAEAEARGWDKLKERPTSGALKAMA